MKKLLLIIGLLIFMVVLVKAFSSGSPNSVFPNPNGGGATSTPISQAVTLDGVTITPLAIMEDSRCPEGVQCIWAGAVKLRANLSKPSGNWEQVLELGKAVSTGSENVTLISVTPNAKQGVSLELKDYDFEFTVEEIPMATPNPGTGGCYVGGCSSQICSEERGAVSTCEFKQEYACYQTAKCERQTNGKCDWTPTPSLSICLNNSF